MFKIFRFIFIFSFYFFSYKSFAQNDSTGLRISVLTCAPGDELYSTFGHSAIRIVDSMQHNDIVYNWGTFDFDTPNFYMKFARGKLLYSLSAFYFTDFMQEYREDQRSVYEQVLNLSGKEKTAIYQAIQKNMQDSNRFYHYDFLFDNCTTRIRDILAKNTGSFNIASQLVPPGTTYRDLLYEYLDRGGEPWTKLGFDILLGSEADGTLNTSSAMFLPEYLMYGIDSAKGNGKMLVMQKGKVFEANVKKDVSYNYIPFILFIVLAAMVMLLSLSQNTKAKFALKIFDSLLFYVTGLLGILILFLWLFSDYTAYHNNWNVAWALPTNFIAAFFILKNPRRIRKYFLLVSLINILLLLFWSAIPQQFDVALVPIVLLLSYRSYRLSVV